MEQLIGTGVALITPFKEDFSIDVQSLSRVVEYNITQGVNYLVVLGTTGESVTLNATEKRLVMDTVVRTNAGRLPLVLGVGGNNTQAVIAELQELDLTAFDAVLSVSPYYNKPTQEGIYQHFKAIAQATPKPIILYNVPGRTGSNMAPETVVRLAKEFDAIVAIKEASGDLVQFMELIQNTPEDFLVISGDDATALPSVLAGGSGVISVLGQGLPSEFSSMIKLGLEGNSKASYAIHYQLFRGMDLIFREGNPAGIKSVLNTLGYAQPVVRLPLIAASETLQIEINSFLKAFSSVQV